jgi:hypothetical protein
MQLCIKTVLCNVLYIIRDRKKRKAVESVTNRGG